MIDEAFETGTGIRGKVVWTDFIPGGEAAGGGESCNVVAYGAADTMARMLAGRGSGPDCIGFIYGSTESPGIDDPENLADDEKRRQSWETVADDVANISGGGNMLIASLAAPAGVSLEPDGNSEKYSANMVTFTGHTGMLREYAFTPGEDGYADTPGNIVDSGGSVYFYQAVLLESKSGSYVPFSRVDMAPYIAKPSNMERSIFWSIIFK